MLVNRNLRKPLSYSFAKAKITVFELETFKAQAVKLLAHISQTESEEFNKTLLTEFLKNSYGTDYFINTKGRTDLVIHADKKSTSPVAVIIETKSPGNKSEMLSCLDLNKKSLQELLLYFLRERITQTNLELKHLIITNIAEWFVFDAQVFERLFAQNKVLVKLFEDFERGALAGHKTKDFYADIAAPVIAQVQQELNPTYFNLYEYESGLQMQETDGLLSAADTAANDKALIPLFKILSPVHLLKLPFGNDANSLNLNFYNELLHILGLTEIKSGGKKLIERPAQTDRQIASLVEKTITKLKALKKLPRISNPEQYGADAETQLFMIALQLNITWINRILFLKLLESQLAHYEKDKTDKRQYKFLRKIGNFSELNCLFFEVLAYLKRSGVLKPMFAKVPYLNSALFEPTDLEHEAIFIGILDNLEKLPIFDATVLKTREDKRREGEQETLSYLLDFLDAYDFSSDGTEDLLPRHKELINAAVLGTVFEKINGYKDGSFFTPSFITMYMCRETLRRAVVQKFNQLKGWQCPDFAALQDKITDRAEANQIINSLKICDPAVGSGHFLVSVLNELIVIKHDLEVLQYRDGKRIKDWKVSIENDDLKIVDDDAVFFEYNSGSVESQRLQEALFHEKQTLIENCLFGVDINPASVQICRLRLWIELLKHAYYNHDKPRRLEVLPNIDINIQCGNSLISRFKLSDDLTSALIRCELSIADYQNDFSRYQNTNDKTEKEQLGSKLHFLKAEFCDELYHETYQEEFELQQAYSELVQLTPRFYRLRDNYDENREKIAQLKAKIETLEHEIAEIKRKHNLLKAFEWRYEFPQVLDEKGDFSGFDVIIGNPPYIQIQKFSGELMQQGLQNQDYLTFERSGDIYALFIEKGVSLLNKTGFLAFITSNKWMRAGYGESLRLFLAEKTQPLQLIDFAGFQVFDSATVDSNILIIQPVDKQSSASLYACTIDRDYKKGMDLEHYFAQHQQLMPLMSKAAWVICSDTEQQIKAKIEAKGTPLVNWDISINYGIKTGFNEAFILDTETKQRLCAEDKNSARLIKKVLRGRDIQKYSAEWAGLWIIATFPALNLNIDNYPAVKRHLFSFGLERLEQSGKKYQDFSARKKTGNEWFETQDQIGYWKEFEKEKIIWQEIVQESSFIYDKQDHFYCLDTARIMTGKHLKFLLGILNSSLFFYAVKRFYAGGGLGEHGVRMKHTFFENFTIPNLSESEQQPFVDVVDKILSLKKAGQDSVKLEREIDNLVFDLYELNPQERAVIIKGAP